MHICARVNTCPHFVITLNQDADLHSSSRQGRRSSDKEVTSRNSWVVRATLPGAGAPGVAQQQVSWHTHSAARPELQDQGQNAWWCLTAWSYSVDAARIMISFAKFMLGTWWLCTILCQCSQAQDEGHKTSLGIVKPEATLRRTQGAWLLSPRCKLALPTWGTLLRVSCSNSITQLVLMHHSTTWEFLFPVMHSDKNRDNCVSKRKVHFCSTAEMKMKNFRGPAGTFKVIEGILQWRKRKGKYPWGHHKRFLKALNVARQWRVTRV